MNEITDEDLKQATIAELEDLEFRIHCELKEREDSTLSSMNPLDTDFEDEDFDDGLPF